MTFSSLTDELPSGIPLPLSTDPTLSEGSHTLSDHNSTSSQGSSSILSRCQSPVTSNDKSPQQSCSSAECETFYEYSDARNPLVWYRVSLLDRLASFSGIPDAVAWLIHDLKRQAEIHPPWRQRMWDSHGLQSLWESSKRRGAHLYLQVPGSSLFPGGDPVTQHNVGDDIIYHFLERNRHSHPPDKELAPDVIYGYREDTLHRLGDIPSWVIDDGKAAEADLFYPFLTIQMQDHGLESGVCLHKATEECMIASSVSVRMLDRLNHRLAACQAGEQFKAVNSVAFSIAMNSAVARLYVTFAWDETRDYVYNFDSLVLEDHKHHEMLYQYIQSIVDWGKSERLQEIRDAIEVVETRGPPWYPRYQS
ncbi:hypothetical protein CDV36_001112 [Fusarium kuroshium]|uniref:DUF7924 domain-containing protein n=1 Tax=Fusarium kuroshium TaxID=2010991 RepID=A0A3M2SNT9_9HYPO|nr:hypothetical protein CDV36_001112 [Fusarium kuroshium]